MLSGHLYCLCCRFLIEFDLSSFCKYVTPTDFSHLKHLRLDANNVTYSSMPPDYVTCLREASDIMFE